MGSWGSRLSHTWPLPQPRPLPSPRASRPQC
ncbi:hypothetical protein MC885_002282 [Smutsia gigantea]|nr:hypothetical protein MC885_002282 [Smutsia gigantea]